MISRNTSQKFGFSYFGIRKLTSPLEGLWLVNPGLLWSFVYLFQALKFTKIRAIQLIDFPRTISFNPGSVHLKYLEVPKGILRRLLTRYLRKVGCESYLYSGEITQLHITYSCVWWCLHYAIFLCMLYVVIKTFGKILATNLVNSI